MAEMGHIAALSLQWAQPPGPGQPCCGLLASLGSMEQKLAWHFLTQNFSVDKRFSFLKIQALSWNEQTSRDLFLDPCIRAGRAAQRLHLWFSELHLGSAPSTGKWGWRLCLLEDTAMFFSLQLFYGHPTPSQNAFGGPRSLCLFMVPKTHEGKWDNIAVQVKSWGKVGPSLWSSFQK